MDSDSIEYPHWVHNIINQLKGCPKCGAPMDVGQLVGIAARIPGGIYAGRRKPIGRLCMCCDACDKETALDVPVTSHELLAAIEILTEFIEEQDDDADDVLLPSPNYPTAGPEQYPSTPFNQERLEAMGLPSRKHALRPISHREVRAFLNNLDRTSLRRTSKSFYRFMLRLGVDLESLGGDPPS